MFEEIITIENFKKQIIAVSSTKLLHWTGDKQLVLSRLNNCLINEIKDQQNVYHSVLYLETATVLIGYNNDALIRGDLPEEYDIVCSLNGFGASSHRFMAICYEREVNGVSPAYLASEIGLKLHKTAEKLHKNAGDTDTDKQYSRFKVAENDKTGNLQLVTMIGEKNFIFS